MHSADWKTCTKHILFLHFFQLALCSCVPCWTPCGIFVIQHTVEMVRPAAAAYSTILDSTTESRTLLVQKKTQRFHLYQDGTTNIVAHMFGKVLQLVRGHSSRMLCLPRFSNSISVCDLQRSKWLVQCDGHSKALSRHYTACCPRRHPPPARLPRSSPALLLSPPPWCGPPPPPPSFLSPPFLPRVFADCQAIAQTLPCCL